jgi:GntR family transcriptional regulator of arabinose operon
MSTLEKDRPVKEKTAQPRYQALAEELRGQILRQELLPGDRLPSFSQLRARHGATPTTAERVYGVLEQEGLVERRQGSGTYVLEQKKALTGNIGFIGSLLPRRRQDFFTSHILEGVQQAIEDQNRHLLYMGTDYALKLEAAKKVDGIIICNVEDVEALQKQLPSSLPRVSLFIVASGITSIVADDYGGAKMAVERLLEAGHRRIACLMEKLPSIARRRFAGYYDAMLSAGIEPQEDWIRLTGTVPRADGKKQPYLDLGRAQMREWLQQGWKETGCTAIVVQNEVAAIGVMQILQEAGIRVPQQVSVIGFDGTEKCDLVVPRLTAVELPLAEVGARGVEVLARQIVGEGMHEQVIVLPMKLGDGESVAPPPAIL